MFGWRQRRSWMILVFKLAPTFDTGLEYTLIIWITWFLLVTPDFSGAVLLMDLLCSWRSGDISEYVLGRGRDEQNSPQPAKPGGGNERLKCCLCEKFKGRESSRTSILKSSASSMYRRLRAELIFDSNTPWFKFREPKRGPNNKESPQWTDGPGCNVWQ